MAASGAPAWAQEPGGEDPPIEDGPEAELPPLPGEGEGEVGGVVGGVIVGEPHRAPKVSKDGLPVMITDCPEAGKFGGTDEERAGLCQLLDGSVPETVRYVAVRTWAEKALAADPRSYRAHFLMGAAQHNGEANLPKALYHLERADALLTEQEGRFPDPTSSAWSVLRRVILELIYVEGEMDHHEAKIRYVDLMQERLGLDMSPLKAWPLMKLKRWGEARVIAQQAIEDDDKLGWQSVGLTALCAIESELRNRDGAYRACMAAADPVRDDPHEGGVALSNAASASVEMFKLDDAERLWLESAKRDVEGTINPWGRLTHLYLRQGRLAEALSALREMRRYRLMRSAYFDQQDQADAELTGAALLMIAGRMEDAHRITARVKDRPDRQGTSSSAFEQNQAGNYIIDRVAKLDLARRFEERALAAGLREAVVLRARAAKLRLEAWSDARRVATILADPERLVTTLRPECPGSIEMPNWLDAEVVHVVGPGVALAAIAEARKEETLPEHLTAPIFAALEAEAYLAQGDDEAALARAELAVKGLLPAEALMRARVAAVGAEAARRLGRFSDAVRLLGHVITTDPGVIRRLGFKLPLELVPSGDTPAVRRAMSALESSPLFDVGTWGYRLAVGETAVVLSLPDGSELVRAPVRAGPRDEDALVRRIAQTAHEDLLVPQVDVTQADIRSLDGGLGGGGRASERARSVLDEVLDTQP